MKIYIGFLALLMLTSLPAKAQNLLRERIWQLPPTKRSIFLSEGIFHSKTSDGDHNKLNSVRHSYSSNNGYERLVFDFSATSIPRIYGYVSEKKNKLYVDFFSTQINPSIKSLGNTKFVQKLDFYPVDKETLSVEVKFKDNVSVDIFYLDKPGRLVVDIKK